VVDGVLYTTTPALAVVALHADSGTQIWRFDPFVGRERETHANRGAVYWSDGTDRRIFFSAARRLYSLDATTGRPDPLFGDSGWVDLASGLGRELDGAYIVATSPGVIFRDLLIQGTRVGEEEGSAPGDVRASAASADASVGVPGWRRDAKTWLAEIERLRNAGDTARADAELAEYKRQQRAYAGAPDR
jgi:quinoprotein glucose dehydrogenase